MIASKIRSSVIRAAVAATACALALAGCSSSSPGAKSTSGAASSAAPTAGGTLHVVRAESFDGWDPDASSAYSSYQTVYAVLEPLVRFGSDGRSLEPGIATKWSYDKAATSWTFTLRDDVTFSDGAPLTSADVAFSAKVWADGPNFGSLYAGIKAVKTPNPTTVVFEMATPNTSLPVLMSWSSSAVYPKDFGGRTAKDFYAKPLGAGAFIVTDWSPGGRITMARNPTYYQKGRPYLDGIEIDVVSDASERAVLLQAGQADISEYVPAATAQQYSQTLRALPASQVEHLSLNTTRAPFDDPAVRAAVARAVNTKAIVASAFRGYGTEPAGILPPNLANYAAPSAALPTHDVAAAKAALAGSKHPAPAPVELIYDSGQSTDELVAQVVQANLKEVGIEVRLSGLETGAFLDRAFALDADMVVWSYGAISPDMVDPIGWASGTGWLFTGHDPDGLAQQYSDYTAAIDDAGREAVVRAVQDEAVTAANAIPLAHFQVLHAAGTNVSGFESAPWGLYYWDTVWLSGS